jgi:hypothetical protein
MQPKKSNFVKPTLVLGATQYYLQNLTGEQS